MSINESRILEKITAAFQSRLGEKWPDIHQYAEAEAKKLTHCLVMIEALKVSKQIDEHQAALHLQIQKNATRTVFLTIEGLGLLAVEAAINAALDAVKTEVNTAVGFVLL